MNISDILIQNNQHNANLRTLEAYAVLHEQREQIRRKNNLKEVKKRNHVKEAKGEKNVSGTP